MTQSIIFDLDGTIIDSELQALEAILQCTKEWGVNVSRAEAATVAGKKWEVAFDLLYRRFPMPLPREEASQKIVDRYQQLLHAAPQIVPGVVDAIQDFSRHFSLALVSGSLRRDVLWALEHLRVDHLFQVILGAEDYPASKPAPDGFLVALRQLGTAAENALVFEDSAAGIASAQVAGIKVVAIESTNHFGHDQSSAHARIKDFSGIDANWVKIHFP